MDNMVAPEAINAPQQMGMVVGGNTLQGAVEQAYDMLGQQAKMHSARIMSEESCRYALRDETGQDLFVIAGKRMNMTMFLPGPQGIRGQDLDSMTPFIRMQRQKENQIGSGIEVRGVSKDTCSDKPYHRMVGAFTQKTFPGRVRVNLPKTGATKKPRKNHDKATKKAHTLFF